ncbi:MAG: thiamine phosphate synthase [Vulcanimicrobiaceae bacterium]
MRAQLAQLLHGIYAIVNEGAPHPVELTQAILAGGARILQYRAKRGIVPEHMQMIRKLTRAAGALLIINDDWRAAQTYGADGVHLGPGDARPEEISMIRKALPQQLIGLSCGTPEEARFANEQDVDYIGVGSVYATSSKSDAGEPIGITGLCAVLAASTLPVAAIGGITREYVHDVAQSGAAMAAVISAIAQSRDPQLATAELVRTWNERS